MGAEYVKNRVLHQILKFRHRHPSSWRDIISVVEHVDPQTIGVDIFDTVLMRSVVGDKNAAAAVASRMIERGVWPGDVSSLLETRARLSRTTPNLGLRETLIKLESEGLTSASIAFEIELEVERELISVVPGAREALKELRQGRSITFVSDMHLDSSFLQELLMKEMLFGDEDSLVVSCEAGSTKSDGGLFATAFGDTLRGEKSVVFIGNNPWADVTRARAAGLRPIPATAANPTRFESAMSANPESAGAIIAATARRHRLGLEPDSGSQIQQLGGQVIGQTMLAFLFWIRERCESSGINSVEFLSRDGELPLRMANAMPPDHWSGLQMGYLHCGRRSWSAAALPLLGVESWIDIGTSDSNSFLLHSAEKVPFSALLDRCRISQSDLPPNHGLRAIDQRMPLADGKAVEDWKVLLHSRLLDKLLLRQAAEPLSLILKSLDQRNVPAEPVSLVDVGWRGHQALMVSAIIREATGFEPVHYHFGGHKVESQIDSQVQIERFALDDSVRPHPIKSPVSCLEMFLASGNARLTGYEEDVDGRVFEVFEKSSSKVATQAQRQVWEGAIELARLMPTRTGMSTWAAEDCSLVEETRAVLELFWNHPTAQESNTLEGLRFERDDAGDSIGRVVRPYTPSEIMGRASVPRQWQQGSLAATDARFRAAMRVYFWLRDRLPDAQT